MRNHMRARRWALTALCAGTTLGAAGLAVAPGQALAKMSKVACSDVSGSGSTLQTPVQEMTFTSDARVNAFTNCASIPHVYYNTTGDDNTQGANGGTGSGTAIKEFGGFTPSPALTPADASNSTAESGEIAGGALDGFIGSDAAPTSAQLSEMVTASGSDTPETVPVLQAPVAMIIDLPAGCTISAAPKFTNTDLLAAWENNSDWTTLLTDAGAGPSGCGTATPILEARHDSSGTTLAFREYLYQLDSANGGSTYTYPPTTSATWPGSVNPDEFDDTIHDTTTPTCTGAHANCGSEGEADAVDDTPGSIGYVNAADGNEYDGFTNYTSGASTFWVELQNNSATVPAAGHAPTGKTLKAAYPITSKTAGNCASAYVPNSMVMGRGAIPTGDSPDWENVFTQDPTQKSPTAYPICTLTYDVAWEDYTGNTTLSPDYAGMLYGGETAAGVENTTRDYFTWMLSKSKKHGQTVVPAYYAALPPTIQKQAASTVSNYVAIG